MRSVASIILFLFIQATAFSQSCLTEGIIFSTQAQIDSFQINYPGCTEIEGSVIISGKDIVDLNGLNVITSIGGNLQIHDNDLLSDFTGLENLVNIYGSLEIGYDIIEDIPVYTIGNPSLTSLAGLDNLNSIGGKIAIIGNNALTSLAGLNLGDSISGSLLIYDNNGLTNLNGLESYKYIEGSLSIGSNYGFGNSALTSLTGLENLTWIEGGLRIGNNHALVSFVGLDNLISIGGSLTVGKYVHHGHGGYGNGNKSLISFTGLENLLYIGGNLSINFNDSLVSLTGIENLAHLEGSLIIGKYEYEYGYEIGGNLSLSDCAIESICDYLANPSGSITTITIEGNASGCSNRAEIEEQCGFGIMNSISLKRTISIFPNPFSTTTTLSYVLNKPSSVTIRIFNSQGQQVHELTQEQPKGEQQVQWNAKGLPAGLYIIRLQAGNDIVFRKMLLAH